MVDSVYRTRSLGIGVSGIPDQYADGKAAKVWQHYIGGHKKRTESYREFFCNLLNDNGVKHILDVACGTGWENDPQFIAQIWQWTRHEIETSKIMLSLIIVCSWRCTFLHFYWLL